MRRSLDPLAAALAAERRSEADIRSFREAAERVEPLRQDSGVDDLVAHRRFHIAVYRASHNAVLIATLDALWDKTDRYRRLGLLTERTAAERDEKAEEHAAIAECVVTGDSDRAAAIMHRHIATSLGANALARLEALSRLETGSRALR